MGQSGRSDTQDAPALLSCLLLSLSHDIADVCSCGAGDVVQWISRRVIRKLRQLGYLEAGSDESV